MKFEEHGNIPDGFLLNPEEVEELRKNKRQLAAYAQQKLRKLMTQGLPNNTLIHTKEMTEAELFDHITRIIASPHTAITEHDKRRAISVFLAFDDYLIDNVPGYCEEGCEIDFGGCAAGVLDELEGLK